MIKLNSLGRELLGTKGDYICNVCRETCGGLGSKDAYRCLGPKCEVNVICVDCVTGWLSKACPMCATKVQSLR